MIELYCHICGVIVAVIGLCGALALLGFVVNETLGTFAKHRYMWGAFLNFYRAQIERERIEKGIN